MTHVRASVEATGAWSLVARERGNWFTKNADSCGTHTYHWKLPVTGGGDVGKLGMGPTCFQPPVMDFVNQSQNPQSESLQCRCPLLV